MSPLKSFMSYEIYSCPIKVFSYPMKYIQVSFKCYHVLYTCFWLLCLEDKSQAQCSGKPGSVTMILNWNGSIIDTLFVCFFYPSKKNILCLGLSLTRDAQHKNLSYVSTKPMP